VTSQREVRRGTLISDLTLSGDMTGPPENHVAMWIGEYPCDKDGNPIHRIQHAGGQKLTPDLRANFSFSSKPPTTGKYEDYHHKMTAYAAIIYSQAQALDPEVTPHTHALVEPEEGESVFNYLDTASSRAQITMATEKLKLDKVVIVGLGGTGSYVLDLLAKTPVREIHLYDGDDLFSHNAFRAPGAPTVEILRERPNKAEYFANIYSAMHRGVFAHPYHLGPENVAELDGAAFAFLCLDAGEPKRAIVEKLEQAGVSFIDVGMGLQAVEDSLCGTLRVTTSRQEKRDHFRSRVSLGSVVADDDYRTNVQVADLNSLCATFAVVKWKKTCGFYRDFEGEHNVSYLVETNSLMNEDYL
jgi:hypothetical protein